MELPVISFISFIFGAVVGSFLNVCIYRIPAGLSISRPGSRCPACGAPVPFYHNIPIVSFLVLRGRCSACRERFSARYPFIEALTGLFAVALVHHFGLTAPAFVYFAFVSALVVITFIDLDHKIIPDRVSLPGIAAGFAASFFLPYPGVLNSAAGIAAGGGILLLVAAGYYLVSGVEGMGGGDVKLLAMVGAFLGWRGVVVTLLAGSLLGAVVGVVIMLAFGKSTKYAIPFGPFLAAGAIVYLFFGEEIITWYVRTAIGA